MININKKYKTRDGREVRIYNTDGTRPFTVHGAIKFDNGWAPKTWTRNGSSCDSAIQSGSDLVEVKEKIVKWVNVYPSLGVLTMYNTLEEANAAYNDRNRIACIKIEFEESEGL